MHGSRSLSRSLTVVIPYLPNPRIFPNLILLTQKAVDLQCQVILCVDSGDNAELSFLHAELKGYKNLEILSQENNSPGQTRNLGIEKIKTDFFTFWDSDDQIDIESMQSVIQFVQTQEPEITVARFRFADSNETSSKWCRLHALNALEISKNPGLWRWIFKTDSFSDIRFSSHPIGEDLEYLCKVIGTGSKISFCQDVTYSYRKPGNNTESQTSKGMSVLGELPNRLLSIYATCEGNNFFLANLISRQLLSIKIKQVKTSRTLELPGDIFQNSKISLKKYLYLILAIVLQGLSNLRSIFPSRKTKGAK